MTAPNLRVQRTRSSPSALREPLTRRPLGGAGIVVAIVILCGFTPKSPTGPFPALLIAARVSGGPTPGTADVTVWSDGQVDLTPVGQTVKYRSQLSVKELKWFATLVGSPEFKAELLALQQLDYKEGCCDEETVYLTAQGIYAVFPATHITDEKPEAKGAVVRETDAVPARVRGWLVEFDALFRRHFGSFYQFNICPAPPATSEESP